MKKLPKRFIFAMTIEEMKAVNAVLWSVHGTFDKSRRQLTEDVSERLDRVVGVPCLCDVSGHVTFLDKKNAKKHSKCGVCLDEWQAKQREEEKRAKRTRQREEKRARRPQALDQEDA
jgi:hypothetical protein